MNHAGKLFKAVLQGGFTLLILFSPLSFTAALADQVTDVYGVSRPENAWAYFKFPNAGHGFDTTYVPTRSDVSNSQFLGVVVTPATGAWGGAEFFGDEDTVFVFTTLVRSTSPVTIPLVWTGDDGHAVFVNGDFVGGGGFGEEVSFDLTVEPDVPVKLELVGYNGPGPWVFQLLRRDTGLPLTSTPGVTIDACTEDVPIEICAVPFAAVTATAQITLGSLANDDAFQVQGTFTLGDGSNGIDPLTEAVTIRVGTSALTIPTGSFHRTSTGVFRFEGVLEGVTWHITITLLTRATFEVVGRGEGAALTGIVVPVPVGLTIGDDSGSTALPIAEVSAQRPPPQR